MEEECADVDIKMPWTTFIAALIESKLKIDSK